MADVADSKKTQSAFDALVNWYEKGDVAFSDAASQAVSSLTDAASNQFQSSYQTVTETYASVKQDAARLVDQAAYFSDPEVASAYVLTMLESQATELGIDVPALKQEAQQLQARAVDAHRAVIATKDKVVREIVGSVLAAESESVESEFAFDKAYPQSYPDEDNATTHVDAYPTSDVTEDVVIENTEECYEITDTECVPVPCAAESQQVAQQRLEQSSFEYILLPNHFQQFQFAQTNPYTFDTALLNSADFFAVNQDQPTDVAIDDSVYDYDTDYEYADDTGYASTSWSAETILAYNIQQQQQESVVSSAATEVVIETVDQVSETAVASASVILSSVTMTGFASDVKEMTESSVTILSLSPADEVLSSVISAALPKQMSVVGQTTPLTNDSLNHHAVLSRNVDVTEVVVTNVATHSTESNDTISYSEVGLPVYTGDTEMEMSSGSLNVATLALKQRDQRTMDTDSTPIATPQDPRSASAHQMAATLQGAGLKATNPTRASKIEDLRDEGDAVAAIDLASRTVNASESQGNPSDHGSDDESRFFDALAEVENQDADAPSLLEDAGVEEDFRIYGSSVQSTYSA